MKNIKIVTVISGAILFSAAMQAFAQGTAFTYQGRLNNGGSPASGLYDFRFKLYVDSLGNTQVGSSYLTNAVPVTNGLFTAAIDFGAGVFTGTSNWLEVDVRTNGVGGYTTLSPFQELTPTPNAIFAETASSLSGTLPAAQLSGPVSSANLAGTYANAVNLTNPGNNFSGNGAGVTNVNAALLGGLASSNYWQTGGNNVAPGQFLGSTNNQPVELWVNNKRAFHIEDTTNAANIIGGWSNNFAAPGVMAATVGGGGGKSAVNSSFYTNSVWSSYGTVGGGLGNQAGNTNGDTTFARGATVGGGGANVAGAIYSTIAGGDNNNILLSSDFSSIGGGELNSIQPYANFSVIGGGYNNLIQGDSNYWVAADIIGSTIAGGSYNTIQTNAPYSTIGGGLENTIQDGASFSTIAGGGYSVIQTNSFYSIIGGGDGNQIQTNAPGSTIGGGENNIVLSNAYVATIGGGANNQVGGAGGTVPGGNGNLAGGINSFAAGTEAYATNDGSFVLADLNYVPFYSTAPNEFSVRAQNGVRIQTDKGIHLNAADEPIIVRDWDVFATNAPADKAGIGRWGLFMEPFFLTIGIPGDDTPGRYFQVAKYNTNGDSTTLMMVDQGGNVTASSFNISSGGTFAGNGTGLTSVNAATLNGFSSGSFAAASGSTGYIQNQNASSQAASFSISGNAQIGGLMRSGSETGTGNAPSPAGLVIRRVNSLATTISNVVARTDVLTLERDGSNQGLLIRYPAGVAGRHTINCLAQSYFGTNIIFHTTLVNPGSAGTIQLLTGAQRAVHAEISFGDTYDSGQVTQVVLDRYDDGSDSDFYWVGTLTSTYNQ